MAVGCAYFRAWDGTGAGQSHVLQTCVSLLQHCRVQGSGCSQTGALEVRTGVSVHGSGDVPQGFLEKAAQTIEL